MLFDIMLLLKAAKSACAYKVMEAREYWKCTEIGLFLIHFSVHSFMNKEKNYQTKAIYKKGKFITYD